MASPPRTLTVEQATALRDSFYPCPPGYLSPPRWQLSAGGVPVPPVPSGAERRRAITIHYYHELTAEQRMDRRWDPDVDATWDAFFDNRRQRELAKFEGDGPPPVNNNEAGRRLWWGGRDLAAVMEYIAAEDHPRLRYPHFQPQQRAPRAPEAGVAGSSGLPRHGQPVPAS